MIFEKQGNIYQLSSAIKLPIDIERAWNFLSDPSNLKEITPKYMGFDIVSDVESKMYAGQIIAYKVSPMFGLKLNWVTEISHVDEPNYFVDEQRFGPYALWHHKHFLKEISKGVEMTDVVHYKLPFSIIANGLHNTLVKPKLMEIFKHRTDKLLDLFGSYEGP
jgi:ligand-binding SRPBCC domain-containing protein